MTVYQEIFEVIKARKAAFEAGTAQENSYTAYLFDKGVDKICKKVGEEATETVIAAKNNDNNELANEINDLLYHVMVLAANQGLDWDDVEKVLITRADFGRMRYLIYFGIGAAVLGIILLVVTVIVWRKEKTETSYSY